MTPWVYNAHDLCVTRICQAANCENDAMPGWPICERHDRLHKRGVRVTLHETPPLEQPTLRCSTCNEWKPDEEFPYKPVDAGKRGGGRNVDRRGRYCYCNKCLTAHQIRQFKKARERQAQG